MLKWKELALLSDEQLAHYDLIEVQWACAEGLPGSERSNLDHLRRFTDECAALVSCRTEDLYARFLKDPDSLGGSEGRFRTRMMLTAVQRDLEILPDQDWQAKINDADSRQLFLHGLIETRRGTCTTLPVLYAAIGRRLGYPIKLVRSPLHLFARWEDEHERFNIECTSVGFMSEPDDYYRHFPFRVWEQDDVEAPWLQSLSPREELANLLIPRGYCLLANQREREGVEACFWAVALQPSHKPHLRSADRMLIAWRQRLRQQLPQGFPELRIVPAASRRFPDAVPISYEDEFWCCAVLEDLLEERAGKVEWLEKLRASSGPRPQGVPAEVRIGLEFYTKEQP